MQSFLSIMVGWSSAVTEAVNSEPRKAMIGCFVKANDPKTVNEAAPSFPPTSVRFQNYEYIAPGQNTATDGPGVKGDNNVLLYLEMAQQLEFPREQLMYSGNFVTPGMDGTICISREIFFDNYLLRHTPSFLLNTLNQSTYAWIFKPRTIPQDQEYPTPEKKLEVGPGSDKDSKPDISAFKLVDGSKTKWEWTQKDSTLDQPREVKLQYWGR